MTSIQEIRQKFFEEGFSIFLSERKFFGEDLLIEVNFTSRKICLPNLFVNDTKEIYRIDSKSIINDVEFLLGMGSDLV